MSDDGKWDRLEALLRRVVREEISVLGKNKSRLEIKNGRWVGVTEDQIAAWKEAFPAVDVDAELKKMAAWVVSNPMMAPRSQWGRFANSWLTKSQNQASLRSIPTERKPEVPRLKLCAYCEKVGEGQVNGRWACDTHWKNAMDGDPVPHMRGIVAKPVAGA